MGTKSSINWEALFRYNPAALPKRYRNKFPPNMLQITGLDCGKEFGALVNCFVDNSFQESKCLGVLRAMNECAEKATLEQKQKGSMNYHLRRITRRV
mmetsp:Transcript_25387/g.35593  ORF Transcript_25387/g.35593 Transcript_25387/m.35593 type:complete len:97 (-) Transcript_25387:38-328(-)